MSPSVLYWLYQAQSAAQVKYRPGDIGAFLAGQVADGAGEIFRGAHAALGNVRQQCRHIFKHGGAGMRRRLQAAARTKLFGTAFRLRSPRALGS